MAWNRWSGGGRLGREDGARTYYGEVNRRMVSTRRNNETEALAEPMRMVVLKAGTGWLLALDARYVNEYVDDCRRRSLDRQGCNQKQRHLDDWVRRVGPR